MRKPIPVYELLPNGGDFFCRLKTTVFYITFAVIIQCALIAVLCKKMLEITKLI